MMLNKILPVGIFAQKQLKRFYDALTSPYRGTVSIVKRFHEMFREISLGEANQIVADAKRLDNAASMIIDLVRDHKAPEDEEMFFRDVAYLR